METAVRKIQDQIKVLCSAKKCVWRRDDGEKGLCGRFTLSCPYRKYLQKMEQN